MTSLLINILYNDMGSSVFELLKVSAIFCNIFVDLIDHWLYDHCGQRVNIVKYCILEICWPWLSEKFFAD